MKQKYIYPSRVPYHKFIFRTSAITRNPLPFHREFFKTYGETFSLASPQKRKIILTRESEIARHILQKNHKKYHKSELQSRFLSKYIGYGLLTSNGDYWLQQRRLIQPAFHRNKLINLVSIIEKCVEEQVKEIRTGTYVDVYPIMNELAFHVVAKSLFNFTAGTEILKRLQFIIEKLQNFLVKEIRQPHKRWLFRLKGEEKEHLELAVESRQIILSLIEERRSSGKREDDLLDMLLYATYEDGTTMTNDQLIDEILILFVAGHETTANALSFIFALLAKHQDKLENLKDEIAQNSELPSIEQVNKLTYARAVINEAMRLYPPAWITDRVAIEDDSFGGYTIEKGTIIGISFIEMHQCSRYWDDPLLFKPERFLSELPEKSKESYFPFGAGPRLCIGNNFAIYEMVLAIKAVVEKYELEATKTDIEINPLVTLKPLNLKLKFTKRA
ncbi:cytochrome P450 [Leptobacterium flavescens]|uniref:Cytochrome P450 n=2 Tax=Leptobacterium flavescens TaxID=472055 RepID=A0A6P0UQK3_9FLAO|nr:cytochrome P450 [Leptobacterium flavescens]